MKQYLANRDAALDELKRHLAKARQKMKQWADGKRRDMEFAERDFVYLKIRPYRQKSLACRRNEKLATHYFGPFEVLERVGRVAFRLKLLASTYIHLVFHVFQLWKFIGYY